MKFKFNYFLYKTLERLQEKAESAPSMGAAWNNSQWFYIQDLGKAFGDYCLSHELFKFAKEVHAESAQTGKVVEKIAMLFGLYKIISKPEIYLEGYMKPLQLKIIRKEYLKYCSEVSTHASDIIEALAPPDGLLGSDIGSKHGDMYRRVLYKQKIFRMV